MSDASRCPCHKSDGSSSSDARPSLGPLLGRLRGGAGLVAAAGGPHHPGQGSDPGAGLDGLVESGTDCQNRGDERFLVRLVPAVGRREASSLDRGLGSFALLGKLAG